MAKTEPLRASSYVPYDAGPHEAGLDLTLRRDIWRTVKQKVHAFARDPSVSNARDVDNAFKDLRAQQIRASAVARWRRST